MPKIFINALTEILQRQTPFVISDTLNRHSSQTARLPHSHNSWELAVYNDGKVQLNPPKVLHDNPADVQLAIEIDLLKISCVDYVSGTMRIWRIPNELFYCHLAPELLTMLMQVYPAQQISQQLFAAMITSLIQVMKNISSADEEYSGDEIVQRLVNFLHTHCSQLDLSLELLSEIFNLSPQYMNRLLRKNGYPPVHTLLMDIRLAKALELLETGNCLVKDVVRLSGWRTASYFSSCFARRYGTTPQAYLTRLKKEKNLKNQMEHLKKNFKSLSL